MVPLTVFDSFGELHWPLVDWTAPLLILSCYLLSIHDLVTDFCKLIISEVDLADSAYLDSDFWLLNIKKATHADFNENFWGQKITK